MSRPLHPIIRHLCLAVAAGLLASACGGSQSYTPLTTQNPVAELPEGLSLSANPAALPADFRVQLSAVPADTFAGGKAGEAYAAALQALPANLTLKSALFNIQTQGHLPNQVFVALVLPAGSNSTSYDLYSWDGKQWQFLPAQASGGQLVATVSQPPGVVGLFEAAAVPPLALTVLEPGQTLTPAAAEAVNAVLLDGVLLQADGSLGGQVPGVTLHQGFGAYPVITDPPGVLATVLGDAAARQKHLENLVAFAVSGGYDGVALNYTGVTPDLGPAFAQFVADVAAQLHSQGKGLFVQVPAPQHTQNTFQTGGYDWRALGSAADALLVPVADDPTAFGSGLADALLNWAVGEVPRANLRLLTSAQSVQQSGDKFSLIGQAQALAPLGSVHLAQQAEALHPGEPISVQLSGGVQTLAYDPAAFAARYNFSDASGDHTLWLTTAATLQQRFSLAQKYRLGGVAVSGLLAPDLPANMLNAISQYKAAVQADVEAHAELLWTVRGSQGILALATAQPNQPFVYTAPSAGQYQFSANLQPGVAGPLGSVSVQVAEVTPTPTPTNIPTATATPSTASHIPSGNGNPTAAPNQPTQAPQPTSSGGGGGGGGFVPPPPVGAGNFELGGQVPGGINHAAQMQQAGMKWVKFQVRDGGDASGFISAGHAAGFKVLISALGNHDRSADPAYWPEYAQWVGGISAQGADAIEVWNEANLDREWAAGQINGASYAGLLKQAYAAIKGGGGAMVIAGAPSPTGAAGGAGCTPNFCNDDVFLSQMADAGAANYMDCMGVHFNDGTTAPDQTSGSALSGYHYSYYFTSMVDLYYSSFGGSRPLCFTELGYLTSEGYPALPSYFSWAGGTTLANQAQWLASTASLAGNSGKVRLMVVFNVDFTQYGADPQAGYAIIRPDGSCPACSALGSVVH